MVKEGEVTGSVMPRPRARAFVKVVLPAPTSPTSSRQRGSFWDFKEEPRCSAKSVSSCSLWKIMGKL